VTWKQVYREVEKAGRNAARQGEQIQKKEAKAYEDIEETIVATRRKVDEPVRLIEKDPIDAQQLFYSADGEIDGEAIPVEVQYFSGSFGGEPVPLSVLFEPDSFSVDSVTIEPLGLYACDLFSVVALRVIRGDSADLIPLEWVKKSDPRSSSVVLLDAQRSEYHYPISTDLTGQVIAGHPRTGLITFKPFRKATDAVAIHFSDVSIGKPGNKASFTFTCQDSDISDNLANVLEGPGTRQQMLDVLERVRDEARDDIATQVEAATSSGCAVALAILGGSALLVASVLAVALA